MDFVKQSACLKQKQLKTTDLIRNHKKAILNNTYK